jgi:hypothetical protein
MQIPQRDTVLPSIASSEGRPLVWAKWTKPSLERPAIGRGRVRRSGRARGPATVEVPSHLCRGSPVPVVPACLLEPLRVQFSALLWSIRPSRQASDLRVIASTIRCTPPLRRGEAETAYGPDQQDLDARGPYLRHTYKVSRCVASRAPHLSSRCAGRAGSLRPLPPVGR